MFKNVNLSNQTTTTAIDIVPKKTSVSSLASIASSVDNSSPYIRLMTDSEKRRKRSSESQGSNESFSRNRKVSESPNQAQINEELMMIPQPIVTPEFIPNKSPKLDKKLGKRANLPFASKAKVQNFQKDARAGGGSKVFANYTAQIKERSAWVQTTQNQTTNQLLAIPGSTTSPTHAHPVRRGSMNDILGQNLSTNRETHFL